MGHLLEHVQADIWVRYQRAIGNECVFVSGNDAHGSAIMLSAQKQSLAPEQWLDTVAAKHKQDIADFGISFDVFHTTRSEENKALVYEMYATIKADEGFVTKSISQPYDVASKMFLPDRFIKGECPKCGSKDQYGDNCEVCGATYEPMDLINPYSVLSNTKPELRDSEHVFFRLSAMQDNLHKWLHDVTLQDAVRNKLLEWFTQGLKDWDVSRDAPYFGFTIPGYEDKYFYVWLDAPIGYIAALAYYDKIHNTQLVDAVWRDKQSEWEIHHFVGKDIMYFHGLFWPATLESAGLRTPNSLHVHGFLTVNGAKMSKSRGTFITMREYLNALSPEYIRYYFACKLNASVEDMDLNWEDCARRCNSDLVGKIINVGSRSCGFVHKYFDGVLGEQVDVDLFNIFVAAKVSIMQAYEAKSFARVVREVTKLADLANQYVDQHKPWQMAKDPEKMVKVHEVVTTTMHLFRLLVLYLGPVIPETGGKVAAIFHQKDLSWATLDKPLGRHKITAFPRLLERIQLADCPVS